MIPALNFIIILSNQMRYRQAYFNFRHSQDNLAQVIQQIKEPISIQANKISERLSQFVKNFVGNLKIDFDLLADWSYDIESFSLSPICSKLMNDSENYCAFKCYDCMQSKSSCICAACFAEGNHKGHNYVQYQTMNGCCDCGNDEAWNQKGFCKNHGKQHFNIPKIGAKTQKQYIQEMSLLFFIYFHLASHQKGSSYRQKFGNGLFQTMINYSQQCYQMKYLAYKLLCSSLSLSNAKEDSKESILHQMFLMQPSQELDKFVQLSFQIFPVREFRIAVIKEYFEKVNRQNQNFTCQHQLASMNYQFLTCVKLINEMITSEQLKPLTLHQYSTYQRNINFPAVFKKYYEDIDYINYMKSSKQYHVLHLFKSNVCDLCFYRTFTTFKQSQLTIDQIMDYRIDETFLKHFSFMVKNIREEKKIIQKCLKELFEFIANAKINLASLAHERAFTLLTFAYFDGDIYQLKHKQISNNFVNLFKSTTSNINQQIVQNIFTTCLITKINIQQKSEIQIEYNQHERYFFSCNPQKNFNQFLDIGFHKIILLISQQQGWSYDVFIYNTLIKLQTVIKSAEQKFHQKQREQCEEFKQTFLMTAYKKLYILLNFLNSVTTVTVDEFVIAKYVGMIQQQKIFNFFRRILATFLNINVKQFKALTLLIVNEEDTLEKFIRSECSLEKGKIKSLKDALPLQTTLYYQIFKNYQKDLSKEPFTFLNRQMKNKCLLIDNVFNSQTIHLISQINMNFLFRFSGFENYHHCSELFSKIGFQLIIIYLDLSLDHQKYFFQALLQPGCRNIISKELFEQIIKIQKEGETQIDKYTNKNKQQLMEQKKKEKLLAKKKQIQATMKKNQKKMMNNYDNILNESILNENSEECIYCRSTQEDNLNYISYIGLTNFYENKAPSYQNSYHVYFQSCGHKIHSSCFQNVMMKRQSNYCFLCRRETNILIPELSKKNIDLLSTAKMLNIVSVFQAAIINVREEIGAEIQEPDIFLTSQNISFQEQLVQGICRDFMFLGLKNYELYRKTKLLIHFQLFLLLRYNPKQEIFSIFDKIKPKSVEKIAYIQLMVQNYFKTILLAENLKQIQHIQTNSQQQQQIKKFFSNFLNQKRQQLSSSNLIDIKDLFYQLPQSLNLINNQIGQCRQCGFLTSFIYICLKCGWSSCKKCLNKIFKHSTYAHFDGSIFISCSNGAVKFFHGNKIFEDDSIYQNYLGQPFNEVTSSQSMKIDKFYLNKQKLSYLQAMCLEYGIHQKIFLNDH